MKKIVSVGDLEQVLPKDKKLVLVGGCFDLFHYGHLVFLNKAREMGDVLVVLLESDEFIKNRKKRTPIHNQQQRAEILSLLLPVDFVVKMPYMETNEDYDKLVNRIRPDVIAITAGDTFSKNKKIQAQAIGARLVTVTKLLSPFSSTRLLQYAAISSN